MEPFRSENQINRAERANARLSEEGLAALRKALDTTLADGDPVSSPALKHAVQRICIDARRSDLPPERLLVAFKTAMHTLPAVQRLTRGPDRDDFVRRLVSLCIDEYYGKQPRPPQYRTSPP
ncbi:MAG TPA: hypothetical protein VJN70_05920 [Gemmatimonadaceae bacterium]|nr:hypothetical protein [Gemmatimonadaceae bacterium]